MMRARSLMQKAVLVAVLAALFLLALPAMAQEDQGSTTTSSVVSENLTPAVPIETPVTPPATPDWTYRYLIDRKSTRLNSSHVRISYAVFCLKKKKKTQHPHIK